MKRVWNGLITAAMALMLAAQPPAASAQSTRFNPDTDPSRIDWTDLSERLGPAPDVRGKRFGIVIKTQVNEYWRQMAEGYRNRAAADGVKVDIQAAQTEEDPLRQLAIMHNMVANRYSALMISPISPENLHPAIEDAKSAGVPVVDVDGAVADNVANFVGPINRAMGRRVAEWFIENVPAGGKVAVIEGQAGVFSTVQRSAGLRDALLETGKFEGVASLPGNWDREQAFEAATTILKEHPDLVGLYCNNDTMAFGAVDAARSLGLLGKVKIFGSDGTKAAYASIRAGELTGTVDIFPTLIGSIGLEVAERLSVGQEVPRVVETPQALIVKDNVDRFAGGDEELLKMLSQDAL